MEEGMATHSSILSWRIPGTEEPGGLQWMGLQRAGHDWAHTYLSSTLLANFTVQYSVIDYNHHVMH